MYRISFTSKARKDLLNLRKNELQAYKKANKLIEELKMHPHTGTGKVEKTARRRKQMVSPHQQKRQARLFH